MKKKKGILHLNIERRKVARTIPEDDLKTLQESLANRVQAVLKKKKLVISKLELKFLPYMLYFHVLTCFNKSIHPFPVFLAKI